ncbi:MAG TPA: hypothetical protein VF074_12210 [Pyrinomonadaceae bacterium]
MSKIKNSLIASSFFLALFIFAPIASYGQTAKPAADVNVVNTPSVRDADNPARQPFTETLVTPNKPSFTVPAGKRLVIEFVSGDGFITSGQKFLNTSLQCTVTTSVGVADVLHAFTPTLMGTQNTGNGPFDIFSISQQTRLYVEPGGKVSIFMNNTAGVAGLGFTVTGYLVDAQ